MNVTKETVIETTERYNFSESDIEKVVIQMLKSDYGIEGKIEAYWNNGQCASLSIVVKRVVEGAQYEKP